MRISQLTLGGLALAGAGYWLTLSAPAAAQSAVPDVAFYHEFFGRRGYTDPQAELNLRLGMMNGLTFSPPVEDAVTQITGTYNAGLMLHLAGASAPAGISEAAIELQRSEFNRIANAGGARRFHWNLLPEWDQSGGAWVPAGRPRYNGLSRTAASARFLNYYQSTYPTLFGYLRQPAAERNYLLAAVTDYAPNVYRTYEFGVDRQLLERGIDELGDLSTGLAFIRGAARQFGREWGVDFASWRTTTNSATRYNDAGTLLGGWSASYFRRNYFAAFAAGARTIQNQAVNYRYSNGALNPFGVANQEFADYALRRHPEVAQPLVSTAILIDHNSGFDPKHGLHNQSSAVWYQDILYSEGDYMMDNFFRLAFPNHWLHGLTPQAPFADRNGVPDEARFRAYLAAGGDPRPYEPMATTRWGDNFDVITNRAAASVLSFYKTIILIGDVPVDARLRGDLREWVNQGGVLVMNASQAVAADEDLLGVSLTNTTRSATASRWLPSTAAVTEAPYDYRVVRLMSADVLAVNEANDPLVTYRRFGGGEVLLTTPDHLQNKARQQILTVGEQLLDSMMLRFSPVRVNGPPVEYVVSEAAGKLVVTLLNHARTEWSGEVVVRRPVGFIGVMEYLADQPIEFRLSRREVAIPVRVPPYDLRVVAVESTVAANAQSRGRQ
ncbi:MAG: hypothetical protein K2X03_30390 [Bryobacteraceae bacterium]|nr:hypothetical protein [Bryobacteraceae bacterium]